MMAKQRSQVLPIDWDKDGGAMGNKERTSRAFQMKQLLRITPADAADTGDARFEPWVRKICGEEWQPTPVSFLENITDRGACWATVHRVTEESDMTERDKHTESEKNQMSKRKEKRLFLLLWQIPYAVFHQAPSPSLKIGCLLHTIAERYFG